MNETAASLPVVDGTLAAGKHPAGQPAWWGNAGFLASIVLAVGLWQLSSLFLNKIFISNPVAIVTDFVSIMADGSLPSAFAQSAFEMGIGFLIAATLGIGLGVLMGRSRLAEKTFDPLVNFANATPTIALLPLMEIWFGLGMAARLSFIIVISIWTMLINTLTGIKNVNRGYGDVAKAFGLSGWKATREVYIPAAMPYIVAGARIALAQAAVGMILSGQEVGESGLGGLTEDYGTYYQTGSLIAAIFASTALAMLAFGLVKLYQVKFHPWIAATAAARR
ncbi:MAG: ABC transporter permease [Chloroflexota bacterium]|nr:ABC transporter permease [Chloroflexota bacterium]